MINKISDNLASLKSNGVKVVTSSTRPSNAVDGQVIYETDTNRTLVYDNSAWVVIADPALLSVDSTNSRVGIGTTSPTVPLDVVGDVNITTASGDGYLQVLYQAIDTALYANLTASGQMDAQEVSLFAQNPNTEISVPLRLTGSTVHVVGDFNVDQDTLFVDSTNSRVGIGTTSPSVPLDVNGSAQFTSASVTNASTSSSVVRNITLSTSAPTGGNDGDVWMVYS